MMRNILKQMESDLLDSESFADCISDISGSYFEQIFYFEALKGYSLISHKQKDETHYEAILSVF